MGKRRKKTVGQRLWIGISVLAIIAMVFFTIAPLLSAGGNIG